MNDSFLKLLSMEAAEITAAYNKASIEGEGTPQEIADRREEYFKSFISKYYPYPYRIVKGNIIDSYGYRSQSIDCIVINPSHPYTINSNNGRASVIFADGVDMAIEIKPDLSNRTELERALKQIQSVKKLQRVKDGLLFHNKYNKDKIKCSKTIPCAIVSEKTYSDPRTLINNIYSYYIENKVPALEQFDLILVNNQLLVYNFRNNTYLVNGEMEGIAFWKGGKKCLALFLLEINNFPNCEPRMSRSIIDIYLKDLRPKELEHFKDLDEKYRTQREL